MTTPSFIVKFKDPSALFNGVAAAMKIPGMGLRADIAKNNNLMLKYNGYLKAETAEKLADIPGVTKVTTPATKKPRL